jgi:tetratricopeptide (TPR) repeat protein
MASIILLCVLGLSGVSATVETDLEALRSLQKYSRAHDDEMVRELAAAFLKKYPGSRYVPDVRFIDAEHEKEPEEAIRKFRLVMDKYRAYPRRDFAQFRICEIYELLGSWERLQAESRSGMMNFPKSRYFTPFELFFCGASVRLYQFDQARRAGSEITRHESDADYMASALLMDAHSTRRIQGYSREYIYALRDMLVAHERHHLHPTVILLLGDFYENTGDPGRALSAYEDLAGKYPRSPEAAMVSERLETLRKKGVKKQPYAPDKKTIEKASSIDISPEMRVSDENMETAEYYCVAIGPIPSGERAVDIQHIIKNFGSVKTVRIREGFIHYVGRRRTAEEAMTLKIELAEEYGINGSIVLFTGNDQQQYIYGEEQ